MKDSSQKVSNKPKSTPSAHDSLHEQVIAAEKSVQKARADYDKKSTAYEDALKQQSDKITILSLQVAAKIARWTFKIKRMQYKLAKANWKAAEKAGKKAELKASKETQKSASKKIGKKAPKDAVNNVKSGKKKVAARA